MGWLRSTFWRLIFRSRAAQIDREVDDELRTHIELRIEDNIADGMSARDARKEAYQRFGSMGTAFRTCRALRLQGAVVPSRRRLAAAFVHDMGHGVRLLARNPAMSAIAILSLALGISSATIISSAARDMLFRRLPYPEADRLVTLSDSNVEYWDERVTLSAVDFTNWQQQDHIFERFAGFIETTREVTGIEQPEVLPVHQVSAGLLELLGIAPELGRAFTSAEHSPGGDRVVILSHAFWRERMAARQGVLGETLTLRGQPHVIVGVLGAEAELLSSDGTFNRRFTVHQRGPALLLPMEQYLDFSNAANHFIRGVGRLATGLSFADAEREAKVTVRKLEESFPHGPFLDPERLDLVSAAQTIYMAPLRDDLYESFKMPLRVAGAATLVLLLIACANVGGLLAGRIARREPELAARAALGAGRGRIVSQLVAESAALAAPALAGGLILSWWGARLLDQLVPPTFYEMFGGGVDLVPALATHTVINPGTLSFAVALTLGTVLAFGLLPALAVSRHELAAGISGTSRLRGGRWSVWSRNTFVIAQVALSLALLIGSGLLINTYWRYAGVDVGLDAERVLVLQARLADRYFERVPAPEEFTAETGVRFLPAPTDSQRAFLRDTVDRLEALPGVESVAAWNFFTQGNFDIRGRPRPADRFEQRALFGNVVSTLGIELRAGSIERLAAGEPGTMAINQTFADRYFPGEDPIGHVLEFNFPGIPDSEIVAVVGDHRYSHDLRQQIDPSGIMRFTAGRQVHFLIRTNGDPLAIAEAARRAIWSVDPNQPIQTVRPLEEVVYESVTRERIFAQLLGFFALVGLFLALLGIYGVINLFVALSTRVCASRSAHSPATSFAWSWGGPWCLPSPAWPSDWPPRSGPPGTSSHSCMRSARGTERPSWASPPCSHSPLLPLATSRPAARRGSIRLILYGSTRSIESPWASS